MPPAGQDPPAPGRLASLDLLRGLIMVLMAIDHAAFHIAKRHPGEFWGAPLPDFPNAAAFLTRFVTHLCAPGFFFLMGAGMVLLAAARRRAGWSERRIARHLALRGLLLIVLQQLLENPTWAIGYLASAVELDTYGVLPPSAGGTPILALAVLFGLGSNLIIGAALLRLPALAIGAVGVAAILATQVLTPGPEQVAYAFSPLARVLMIPGHTGAWVVIYPVVPWLAFTCLGMVFGRLLLRDPRRAFRTAVFTGAAFLLLFVAVRLAGSFGNFHPPADGSWIAFLNVTKYPPSLAFLLITLGMNLLLLGALHKYQRRLDGMTRPLLVFGGTALFFYFAHLYLYMLLGLAFPRGAGLPTMYGVWLLGLLLLYPLCRSYAAFKRGKPAESLWRMF